VNRVFVVLLALVATPVVASVAQDRPGSDQRELKPAKGARRASGSLDNPGLGHDAAHCAMRARLHPGESINKCPDPVTDPGTPPPPPLPPPPPPPPPPTSTCGSAPVGGGTVSIDGQVYQDFAPWSGLEGWCVQLSGPEWSGLGRGDDQRFGELFLLGAAGRHVHGLRSAPGQLA